MALPSWNAVVAYGSSAVELAGAVVGLRRWRRIAGGQRAITLWFTAAAMTDVGVIIAARQHHNTQSLIRIWFALSVILALDALSRYQFDQGRVAVFRLAIGMYLAAWLVLLTTIEPLAAFASYSAPLHTVVILSAAVLTLLRRASIGRGELMMDSGFLIAAGLAGYAVADVFEMVVAPLWATDFPQGVMIYNTVSNLVTALAELVIIKALFLPPSPSRRTAT